VIDHRQLGVDLFNHVWTLLGQGDRTVEDDDEMVHAAHASRFHWGEVGTAENLGRGEWQISRVYSVLGRAEPALYHARRYLEICERNGIADWDLAFAYEALARASRVAGDEEAVRDYVRKAREAGEQIADQDDREHFESDIVELES
jgi:hypothetical protein